MSALSIQPTFPIFTDIDGQPLEDGYIFIGAANLNPQTNPIVVYQNAALTTVAVQPIRTRGGYPVFSGTPGRLFVGSDYSIQVQNKNGSVVYSAPAATERYSDAVISSVNAEDVTYDPPFLNAVQTNVEAKLAQTVSVKDFGALGDGNQALFPTNYSPQTPYVITQQTADGLAINKAIVYLRSIGGGALYFPKGEYRVWGYLEKIDFPCVIYGDGIGVTVLKNCDTSPTNAHAYGILIVMPATLSAVTVQNMTLDGNATVRAQPTGEFGSYPLGFYGSVQGTVENVESKNSPIDCLLTSYDNTTLSSLRVSNCIFSNAYRNTVSCVAGWNQQWSNCIIEKGGRVYTGTAPGYCLDIEPNLPAFSIKNLTFTNCLFREAIGVVAGGVWAGNVRFDSCFFDCSTGAPSPQPWAGAWRTGQFSFTGCTFSDTVNFNRFFTCFGTGTGGEFVDKQFIDIQDCYFEGVGFQGFGPDMTIEDTRFLNCLYPVLITGNGVQSATVRNVTLINVVDIANAGGGMFSSFGIPGDVEGYVDIDGLHIRIEPSKFPALPSFGSTGTVTGIYLAPSASSIGCKVSNVNVAGYYQKYPTHFGYALDPKYRDWGNPNTAPANTAGQIAAPGVVYYANCTMYGNNP